MQAVLFIMLRDGIELTDDLQQKIHQTISVETTPRHVPAKIIALTDIPRTSKR